MKKRVRSGTTKKRSELKNETPTPASELSPVILLEFFWSSKGISFDETRAHELSPVLSLVFGGFLQVRFSAASGNLFQHKFTCTIASVQILDVLFLANLGQSKTVFTHLTVYDHEYRSGDAHPIFPVAGLPNKTWGFNQFGTVFVLDNFLTQSISPRSGLVGRLQGLVAVASLDNINLELAFMILFSNGKYNGITVEIKGIVIQSVDVKEVAIVRGTKQFRHATGYITFETVRSVGDYDRK
ncbi:dirigent protein 19-like [Coffea eugenioides]|uniref:dirigent protein 19-like n=1 Tax=Coffea eugenioides TaxID=49369 RepID=UPI000F60B6BA|nr:dirigent protein 19-like [Coffea eugenioides]